MTAYGVRRALFTLAGIAGAAAIVWTATLYDRHTNTGYWYSTGLLVGAGVAVVLSQLAGGWTKDGMPHVSPPVFLLAFLPALVVLGWVLVAAQPDANAARGHVTSWSRDLHVNGLVNDWRQFLPAIAFLFGLSLGLVLDTSGRRVERTVVEEEALFEPAVADRATTRERIATGTPAETPTAVHDDAAPTRVDAPRRTVVP